MPYKEYDPTKRWPDDYAWIPLQVINNTQTLANQENEFREFQKWVRRGVWGIGILVLQMGSGLILFLLDKVIR